MSLVLDSEFRWRFVHRITADLPLLSFVAAIALTAAYSILLGDASAAPFVDTFLAAVVTTIVLTCVPNGALLLLRRLVDLFFVLNIFLIFAELVLHVDFLQPYVVGVIRTPEELAVLGGQMQGTGDGRLSGLFGHPLNAAMLFGTYSIANLVATPMRNSIATFARVALSILSYLAIFPTESRASMVVTTIILGVYIAFSAVGSVVKGRINPVALSLAFFVGIGLFFVMTFLWGAGFFDKMLLRFQYDYGSALSRDYALDILQSISPSALWFGLSQSEFSTLQQSFGLIAIEISWVNFILAAGLITTVPLFITFCLFLFGSLPRYCHFGICFVSLLILESTFASNSIWSKTTVFTNSLIVGISLLRRDDLRQRLITTATRAGNLYQGLGPRRQFTGQRA